MDGTIRLLNVETSSQISGMLTKHIGGVNLVSFSPDSAKLVSVGGFGDKSILLWSVKTGLQIGEIFREHADWRIEAVTFSSDVTKIVAIYQAMNKKKIWDIKTCLPIEKMNTGITIGAGLTAFSNDGKIIVHHIFDGTIQVHNIETGLQIGKFLKGPTGFVSSVAFSPDGKTLATAGDDETIRIWDAETGLQIGKIITENKDTVNSVSFSPDGTKIVSGGDGGIVKVCDLTNHLCTIIEFISPYVVDCDFRNAIYNGNNETEFYNIIYSNGGLVKDEFKPKPIPFEY